MYMGVDYYPEHWPKDMMDEDIKKMKKMGVNMVRIGEFAWHLMEPVEGTFDFSFFDEVIEKLKKEDIKIMFGTPTATFPAWLSKKHPEVLSMDENQNRRVFGGRRQYCYNSDAYMKHSKRIVEALVNHYKNEPSILVWQIDNEFGHEGSDMCYCPTCHEKFQVYLKNKYKTIGALNETYGTIFWGQTYNDFTEIPIPLKTITVHNPALQLDWARFRSDSLNNFAKEHTGLVKRLKGDHQDVTTNVSGGFFGKWFDHEENLKAMDFVSYDNYPVWGGLKAPLSPAEVAMTLDFNRGLKNKNFWIVEQLIGAQGHDVIGYLPRPNQSKLWSTQAFAHGCNNMLFFRWRGMNKGAEQFCYGILDHDNLEGRKYKEAREIISLARENKDILNSPIKNKVAVLYDYDNVWSWRFQRQSEAFDYTAELMRLYRPLHDMNVPMDVVPLGRDLSDYDLVLIPAQQIVDEDLESKLKSYVENGGSLVMSFRAGIRDRDNNLHFNETLPGKINDLLGLELGEVESLGHGQIVKVDGVGRYKGIYGECGVWRDLLIPKTAEVLIEYDDGLQMPKACMTKNKFGKGQAYYIGAGVSHNIMKQLMTEVTVEAGIETTDSVEGLEVVTRLTPDGKKRFILNHNAFEVNFEGRILKAFESIIE
ncbi:beta-galactosidase [Fusibacter sp. JL216-2]|uniref:beta-galactosidase n=1 Tax=Fusibacter sp. JL216-2 TaxID=3071453 RepID=UPI003D35960C